MKTVFDYIDYKKFLNQKLDELDEGGRGSRARMSREISVQTAYTAQVLRGSSHFSLEQGEGINEFLGHTEEEADYFLLILQLAKAGTPSLRARLEKQVQSFRESHALLKNRLQINTHLKEPQQNIYYSSWAYAAVHALVSIPGFHTPEKIAKRLNIETKKAAEILQFLIQTGLLEKNSKGNISIGTAQVHLGSDSPLIAKHHLHWRLQAMQSIERNPQRGLHYSSVISISADDSVIIREKIIEMIKDIKPVIRKSKEEELHSLSLDFFEI